VTAGSRGGVVAGAGIGGAGAAMLGRLGEVRHAALRAVRDNAPRLVLGRFGADRSVRAGQQEAPAWLEGVA
jgi:hypothetical protein